MLYRNVFFRMYSCNFLSPLLIALSTRLLTTHSEMILDMGIFNRFNVSSVKKMMKRRCERREERGERRNENKEKSEERGHY